MVRRRIETQTPSPYRDAKRKGEAAALEALADILKHFRATLLKPRQADYNTYTEREVKSLKIANKGVKIAERSLRRLAEGLRET